MTASSGGFFSSGSFSPKLSTLSLMMLFAVAICTAQQEAAPSSQSPDIGAQASPNATREAPITIPAGTHLALALSHPVDSHIIHRGDEIFAQTTAPVIVSNQVVIPAGTFVQGKVEKLAAAATVASS